MFQRVALIVAMAVVLQSVNGYQNPVLNTTSTIDYFYGTSVLKHNNVYHLITTDRSKRYIQMRTSTDLQNWTNATNILGPDDALGWISDYNLYIYDPSELKFINGQFVLYIGTYESCIGVATAKKIKGPYEVQRKPLLCGIDGRNEYFYYPSVFKDKNALFLYYNHYNGKRMTLEVRPLTADGLTFADPNDIAVALEPTEGWEGTNVFAPTVVKYLDLYYLIYEGGCKGLFVSRSHSPRGPFQKQGLTPIVSSDNGEVKAPRYSAVVKDIAGNNVLVYSSGSAACYTEKYYISVANLVWDSHMWPAVVNVGNESDSNQIA